MAANGHIYCVNFILDDKMLQYCHVFMLHTFIAYMCQQYVCVLSAILAANGQTWHEYALTVVNSPMQLIKDKKIVALFQTITTKRLESVFLVSFALYDSIVSADLTR